MHTLEQLKSGELKGIKRLQMRCGLTEFPNEIFNLADSLEILDLSGNQLNSLPKELPRLQKLRVIFCSDNLFTELPEVLGQCSQLSMIGFKANRIAYVSPKSFSPLLRWLILTDNEITELPSEIGQCKHMQKLMLAGNALQSLPPELANCSLLELLRISANQLKELPQWLLNLPRLTWLAFAGNPFTKVLEARALADAVIPKIAWSHLQLEHQLGEGASGVIHQAKLITNEGKQAVAVKIFKGSITSDGLPECEMAACIQAGNHPQIVSALRLVTGHPKQMQVLVMPLITPEFMNLANPPSLESCTRDVYAIDNRFNWDTTIRIAAGVVSAALHLFTRGISHGDLYAHNILHTKQGEVRLGDFGAAGFIDISNSTIVKGIEKLEVRAVGCLLEELVTHCDAKVHEISQLQALAEIAQNCMSEEHSQRPSFKQLWSALKELNGKEP